MNPSSKAAEELTDRLVETTCELLSFNTANPPGETTDIIEFIEDYFKTLGVDTERITSDPAKPNLVATVPGASETTLLYLGHVDTVPYDSAKWTFHPLGEIVDNRVYGRGATDMKGALAAMMEAVRELVATTEPLPVTIKLAFVSDEEVSGDAGLPAVLEQTTLDADACVIGETTCQYGNYSVTVADRGSLWLTLKASGESAHGSRPILGENAIDTLYAAVTDIREKVKSYPQPIPPEVDPIITESVAFYEPVMGEQTARGLFEKSSVNLGIFEGGNSINTVPDTATARVDIRASPGVDTAPILKIVQGSVNSHDGVELVDVSRSIGTYESLDSPLIEAITETANGVTDSKIYRRSATGGGDVKTLRNHGVSTVEFAFGTDTVHAVDEYITSDDLMKNTQVFTRLPFQFADIVAR